MHYCAPGEREDINRIYENGYGMYAGECFWKYNALGMTFAVVAGKVGDETYYPKHGDRKYISEILQTVELYELLKIIYDT